MAADVEDDEDVIEALFSVLLVGLIMILAALMVGVTVFVVRRISPRVAACSYETDMTPEEKRALATEDIEKGDTHAWGYLCEGDGESVLYLYEN